MMKKLLFFVVLLLVSYSFYSETEVFNVYVSGQPAVKDTIKVAVVNKLRSLQGDFIAYDHSIVWNKIQYPEEIMSGSTAEISIPVQYKNEKGDYKYYRIPLKVFNSFFESYTPRVLFVSNYPEKIVQPGKLFDYRLTRDKSFRILLHHKNDSSRTMSFILIVTNPTDKAVTLKFTSGLGASSRFESFTGHVAMGRFIRQRLTQSGEIVYIKPHDFVVLINQQVGKGNIISGFMELSGKEKLDVVVEGFVADDVGPKGIDRIRPLLNMEPEQRRVQGYIKNPFISKRVDYNLHNSSQLLLRVGDEPFLKDHTTGKELRGNYGVWYEYIVTLKNSEEYQYEMKLFFQPAGGLANAHIVVDNILYDVKPADPKSEISYQYVAKFTMEPLEERKVVISTIPEAGSYYPVNIIIHRRALKYLMEGFHDD
ncbi:hypothetical protein ACFL56_02455 [Candidatus Margulisiibacteriota bacterium]